MPLVNKPVSGLFNRFFQNIFFFSYCANYNSNLANQLAPGVFSSHWWNLGKMICNRYFLSCFAVLPLAMPWPRLDCTLTMLYCAMTMPCWVLLFSCFVLSSFWRLSVVLMSLSEFDTRPICRLAVYTGFKSPVITTLIFNAVSYCAAKSEVH